MKTSFRLDNGGNLVGRLDVHDRNNTLLKVFDFDFYTINNWYPLNFEYDLIYRLEHDTLQVVPDSRGEILYVDYGITDSSRKLEYTVAQGLDKTVFKPVKFDNEKVCKKAKELNLPTWLDEDFTYEDTKLGLNDIEHKIDLLTKYCLKDYYFALGQDEQVNYMNLSKELKEHVALNTVSEKDFDLFIMYGKIYTMLSVMRKVSKLYA